MMPLSRTRRVPVEFRRQLPTPPPSFPCLSTPAPLLSPPSKKSRTLYKEQAVDRRPMPMVGYADPTIQAMQATQAAHAAQAAHAVYQAQAAHAASAQAQAAAAAAMGAGGGLEPPEVRVSKTTKSSDGHDSSGCRDRPFEVFRSISGWALKDMEASNEGISCALPVFSADRAVGPSDPEAQGSISPGPLLWRGSSWAH